MKQDRARFVWFAAVLPLVWTFIAAAAGAEAQDVRWDTQFTFYADNTEFTTPYRKGETILGVNFKTFLADEVSEHIELLAGVFADHRSGDTSFLNPVKPILSFRYHTPTSLGVLGTLETKDRHGFLEPLEVTTLDFDRPVEYGAQWIEHRHNLNGDLFLNWQHLNTSSSREIFDYGETLSANVAPFAEIEAQVHGVHHGGELFDVGPVANDIVYGPGLRLSGYLPVAGESSLRVFKLYSKGKANLDVVDPWIKGHGTYLRASVRPYGFIEVFAIWWHGESFISTEGDNNYNSIDHNLNFYRSSRRYQELGLIRKITIDRIADLDAEFRLHRIDGSYSYSYRLVVSVPIDFVIDHGLHRP